MYPLLFFIHVIYITFFLFFATTKVQEIDARPSDALTLAVLMDVPIYATEQVIQQVGIPIPEDKALRVNDDEAQKALVAIVQQ